MPTMLLVCQLSSESGHLSLPYNGFVKQYCPSGSESGVILRLNEKINACQSIAGCVQATVSGFGLVNSENVFRVCDQPHPLMVQKMVGFCLEAKLDEAWGCMRVCCTSHMQASTSLSPPVITISTKHPSLALRLSSSHPVQLHQRTE